MADVHHQIHEQTRSPAYHVARAVTAVTAGGSSLLLSGLLLVGTVICLVIATPVLVIFSPVLVPAAITVMMIISGFVTSGGFSITALTLLKWMYDYVSGKHPAGANQLDQARDTIAGKARDIKEFGKHQLTGSS